jgi:phosphonoacetaldehyde hydrolase
MEAPFKHLKAIVFDWAGTIVDHGSRAPALVFQEVFHRRGVEITAAQAREPMGMAKREHIKAIAAMPPVAEAWRRVHRADCTEADIDAIYADFLPIQKETLGEHSGVIEGVVDVVNWCRARGLKIGSSTGYTRELMEVVSPLAAAQGYQPDCVLCAEDATRGRPAPFLLYEAARRMEVYPLWCMIKVDDTLVGIEAGKNAGCWNIGITRTGNGIGLSEAEVAAMDQDALRQRCDDVAQRMRAAGAHYVCESVADLRPVIEEIESRLAQGELPMTAAT